jgi:hypothetical protein
MTEADIQFLIDKFRLIAAMRTRGHNAEARTLFDGIKVADFPAMPKFRERCGIKAAVERVLFYIDLDWDHYGDDPKRCDSLIVDVIEALEEVVVERRSGQRYPTGTEQ